MSKPQKNNLDLSKQIKSKKIEKKNRNLDIKYKNYIIFC